MLDIDGVCLRGESPIGDGAEAVNSALAGGDVVTYLTNNAMRTRASFSRLLGRAGFPVPVGAVVTSAMAAADLIVREVGVGRRVLAVGEAGIKDELVRAGLNLSATEPAAVCVANDRAFNYRKLSTAADAIRAGALFVATNADPTYPTETGLIPGAGSLVAAIATAAGAKAVIAGKPNLPLARLARARSGGRRVVMIGDRADTDILLARRARWMSVLVLTGVTDAIAAANATPRPDLIAPDLSTAIAVAGDGWPR